MASPGAPARLGAHLVAEDSVRWEVAHRLAVAVSWWLLFCPWRNCAGFRSRVDREPTMTELYIARCPSCGRFGLDAYALKSK